MSFKVLRWLAPALATVLGAALFIHLGLWQRGKAEAVEAQLARYEARAHLPPLVLDGALLDAAQADNGRFTVQGHFEPAQQFFVDNRQEEGVAGVHVVTPLKIDGSETRLLVNRGWIAWTQGRRVLPTVAVPDGPVRVTGTAQVPSTKKFFLMPNRQEAAQNLWQRVDLARFTQQSGKIIEPFVLLQDADDASGAADSLVRHWPAPENRAPMHRGYAWQWFGMAGVLLLFALFSLWRALRRHR